MTLCTKDVDKCVRSQLRPHSDIFLAHSVTACKSTDCQRLINQLTSFIRTFRHSGITEERIKFIPMYGTTTFSEANILLKGCQVPFKIVCSLHLLQRLSKRLCGKSNENFGSNFAVFIALIYKKVLVTKTTRLEHILKHVSFAYFIRARYSINVSFFSCRYLQWMWRYISHNNDILLLPFQKLLWLY